jgi:Protein of unknown function (DUF2799)
MGNWRFVAPIATLLAIAGCSGMSKNECRLADWQAIGYEDGSVGRTTDRFGTYRKTCADHGVAPDFQAYQSGRSAGLLEYCQAQRGFREGSRGARYYGVCPPELEARFLEGYDEGRTLYELESGVESVQHQINYRQQRIKEIEHALVSTTTAVLSTDITNEERAQQLVETKQLTEERVTLSKELEELRAELVRRQDELNAYRAQTVSRL